MTVLLTADQMRALEAEAIASGRVTGAALMDHAGRGVVDEVLHHWPKLARRPHRAVVLCGPGNNGGDGYVVARLLKRRGWDVGLWRLAPPGTPDAQAAAMAWVKAGGTVTDWARMAEQRLPDLLVDAVFGTGLTRPIPAQLANIFRHIRDVWMPGIIRERRKLRRVAVDVPSGLCADSGKVLLTETDPRGDLAPGWPGFMDWCFTADLTVTFHAAKLGHALDFGPTACGRTRSVPLPHLPMVDLPGNLPVEPPGRVRLIEPVFERRKIAPARHFDGLAKISGHKFDHGHALVLTGGFGRTGAARLAARAALRVGAGLVTLGAPGNAMMECAGQITALMLRRCGSVQDLTALLADRRITTLCLGPGLGTGPEQANLLRSVLRLAQPDPGGPGAEAGAGGPDCSGSSQNEPAPALSRGLTGSTSEARAVVLDADALTLLSQDPDGFDMLHPACILTPHMGEFRRLFPDIAARLPDFPETGPAFSKVSAAREAAARAGSVVLLKGPDTVIADPSGRASIHSATGKRSAPWLATAGAGDVLAGLIAGLLARGLGPMQAAETAAWLHVETARRFGPGLIAEDLPEALPGLLRDVGL